MQIEGQMKTVMVGEMKTVLYCLISSVTTFQLIRSGCEAYLASVIDTIVVTPRVSKVSVVNEFIDVFSEDLPGLPPQRKVDFEIETILRVALISITPYRMSPV